MYYVLLKLRFYFKRSQQSLYKQTFVLLELMFYSCVHMCENIARKCDRVSTKRRKQSQGHGNFIGQSIPVSTYSIGHSL